MTTKDAFEKWESSHQPFHWFSEFYEIISEKKGFDVIIGNPPYIEYKEIKESYTIRNYQTENCSNLYAFILERMLSIQSRNTYISMIVPLSGHSTERMTPLIANFYNKYSSLHLINLSGDAHPSILFSGVKFRLSIFIVNNQHKGQKLYTTKYLKWYADERSFLFSNIAFAHVDQNVFKVIPKFKNNIHYEVLKKLRGQGKLLGVYKGNHTTYYHNTPVFWIRAHPFIPYFKSERDGKKASTQLKPIRLPSEEMALSASSILSSSLFYIWWTTITDCYHINNTDWAFFPVNLDDAELNKNLSDLCNKLMTDLKQHSKRRVYVYETSGRVEYDEYYPKKSKPIIDKIDRALAKHYGFNDEELDFIINYDIKYRMGKELEAEQ